MDEAEDSAQGLVQLMPRVYDKDLLQLWATQYYIAGRLAARALLATIYGNLLHHAVEMFLKGALIDVVAPGDMKKKYGHNLKRLWRRFKREEADPTLDRFDSTIRTLHEFEDIRYPDGSDEKTALMHVAWSPEEVIGVISGPKHLMPIYQVIIADVDSLVIEILQRTRRNPKSFVEYVDRSGRGALRYRNPHAAHWLRRAPRKARGDV